MAARSPRRREALLAFDALHIEGGLLAPEWLTRAARLDAPHQAEADYRVLRGLHLRDEIGRAWRIAQALHEELRVGLTRKADPAALSARFVLGLLRDVFGFGSLAPVEPLVVGERSYPIGHAALGGRVPVVVAPAGAGLDAPHAAFGEGGRRRSPFGLLQEALNAADGALWGLACDGDRLRVARDNASLTRPAWIEADLGRIFAEERFADFTALWLLIHETRFGTATARPEDCPLEAWREAGRQEGTRALGQLRVGVKEALAALGEGFLAHPDNHALRGALEAGRLTRAGLFQQLLRLAYRLIFLLTVEERELLHPPRTPAAARGLYAEGYGLRRLRERAARRSAHDRHDDLWEAQKVALRGLDAGEPRLGLPALGGLFAGRQCPDLDACRLQNRHLLRAVFRLAWMQEAAGLSRVNWRDMGPEELGSVYESLLELEPEVSVGARRFAFSDGEAGNARKTTGSYYTPDSLVQVLLDSAFEPVVHATLAAHPDRPAEALLGLSIVDPACGSGHFLLAAARRLAAHVARVESDGTPSAADYRHALRRVVGRCIYGVDLNPMAVELCKVALWMEAVEPGLPLGFLDAHVRCGNALFGATPERMAQGIPDDAWTALEGDDTKVASGLKRRNKAEAGGQQTMVSVWSKASEDEARHLREAVAALEAAPDGDAKALAKKEARWAELQASAGWCRQHLVADAWCAAFMWPMPEGGGRVVEAAPTNAVWRDLRDGRGTPPSGLVDTVAEIAAAQRFFHWHLAFPTVFERGGFDVVLGNPPWKTLELEEGADASERRLLSGVQHLSSANGLFPLSGQGRKNLYSLFVERAVNLVRREPKGFVGMVVPTELVQGSDTESLCRNLFQGRRFESLCDLQNRRRDGTRWFPEVHPQYRFSLLTLASDCAVARFAFDATNPDDARSDERGYSLSASEVLGFCGGQAFRVPMFFSRDDARIMASIYEGSTLIGDYGAVSSGLMFNFGKEEKALKRSTLLQVEDQAKFVAVLEGENVHQYDHRFATVGAGGVVANLPDHAKSSPLVVAGGATYLPVEFVQARIAKMCDGHVPGWFLLLRRQARANDSYVSIAAAVPALAVEGSVTVFSGGSAVLCGLLWSLNSLLMNYVLARRQSGPNVNKGIYGLLPLRLEASGAEVQDWRRWIPNLLELSYTAWDLEPFARDVGWHGPPFRWDPARRARLRAELDAAFFHLYGLSRDDTAYILDTFPIVRKNDEKAHGEYRTKRLVLEAYDALAAAARSGDPYVSPLDPPPADPRVTHDPATRPAWAKEKA
jgi:hypothetical protein